jgi:hypothetical protein
VIIDDLDILGRTLPPHETDSPPIVDSYAALPLPITHQTFTVISGHCCKVFHFLGIIDHSKLSSRHRFNVAEPSAAPPVKQLLGVP